MKTFTIIYLHARKMPKETMKMEIRTDSPAAALHEFIDLPGMESCFVAAIVEGPAGCVYYTRPL